MKKKTDRKRKLKQKASPKKRSASKVLKARRFGDPTPNPTPANNPQAPANGDMGSSEVVIHELGESIAQSLSSVQNELSKYQNGMASFVVDEIDVILPIKARMDDSGQLVATVSNAENPGPGVGQFRIRVKPVIGGQQPAMIAKSEPLDSLDLPKATLDKLRAKRIYSVEDLNRVSKNPAGLQFLKKADTVTNWTQKLGKNELLASKVIPVEFSKALADANVKDISDFIQKDPDQLATLISRNENTKVTTEDIKNWQDREMGTNPKLWGRPVVLKKVGNG